MLMKLLMIDQCITQGGSESGGGQGGSVGFFHFFVFFFVKAQHEYRAVWEFREKGTEKCRKTVAALLLGNGSWIAGWLHTPTHTNIHTCALGNAKLCR